MSAATTQALRCVLIEEYAQLVNLYLCERKVGAAFVAAKHTAA